MYKVRMGKPRASAMKLRIGQVGRPVPDTNEIVVQLDGGADCNTSNDKRLLEIATRV